VTVCGTFQSLDRRSTARDYLRFVYCIFSAVVSPGLDFVFSTALQPRDRGWEEPRQNELFCVEWDVKPSSFNSIDRSFNQSINQSLDGRAAVDGLLPPFIRSICRCVYNFCDAAMKVVGTASLNAAPRRRQMRPTAWSEEKSGDHAQSRAYRVGDVSK